MDEEKKVSETTEQTPKKRGGRKPMSPEEKAAAAKGYPAQGQQQNYRSEQAKRAAVIKIAARLL